MEHIDHILVVDDDRDIRELIVDYLVKSGYHASGAANGKEMRVILDKQHVDLLVLDVMMPGDDGLTLCRQLRSSKHKDLPILMLTARNEDTDRILGLEMGADDYVVKPFVARELLARIKAILRRFRTMPPNLQVTETGRLVVFGEWQLDTVARHLIDNEGMIVALSGAEYRLLRVFLDHPQRVLTRDQLLNLTQGRDAELFERSIDLLVSRVRQRLNEDARTPAYIKTVRSEGYVFTMPVTIKEANEMRLWPRSLLSRLLIIVLMGLLLANSLSLTLVMYERMRSARTVMLGNLEYDVATSVAILDRLPANERAAWLPRLERGNYRYILGEGEAGATPQDKRSQDAIRTLTDTLAAQYPLRFTAVPGPVSHIQAHLQLHDGAPLTIDLIPRMPPVASWLPVVLVMQLLLVALCSWIAVRQVVRPFSLFTRAVDTLDPSANTPMTEQGPIEVHRAAHAFNAMQSRIQAYLRERTQILASISHDLQTPITRMKLRVEMADQPELRDKLLNDLDNMSRLVREGIAYARSSEPLEETSLKLELNAWINSIACDYQDIGKNVQFQATDTHLPLTTHPQALRACDD